MGRWLLIEKCNQCSYLVWTRNNFICGHKKGPGKWVKIDPQQLCEKCPLEKEKKNV